MGYLAVWQAEQDGEPPIERERSHPMHAFRTDQTTRRTNRAEGRAMRDGAAAPRKADRDAVTQRRERGRQA